MKLKIVISLIILLITIVASLLPSGPIFETVRIGTYHIKQAAVTGTMTAIMKPGLYPQLFGDVQIWPKAQTFFFTVDKAKRDQSIEVRFNDGAMCNISGTLRIVLPVTKEQAIALATKHGYESYSGLEGKLILPVVRNALRKTSKMMSVSESFSGRRSDFVLWAWDQIQNGTYETTEEDRKVKDPVSGEMVTRTFEIIKRNNDGKPIYEPNPLKGLGLRLSNFEIKSFVYEKKIRQHIAAQQKALMDAETARAKKAEQRTITSQITDVEKEIKQLEEKLRLLNVKLRSQGEK